METTTPKPEQRESVENDELREQVAAQGLLEAEQLIGRMEEIPTADARLVEYPSENVGPNVNSDLWKTGIRVRTETGGVVELKTVEFLQTGRLEIKATETDADGTVVREAGISGGIDHETGMSRIDTRRLDNEMSEGPMLARSAIEVDGRIVISNVDLNAVGSVGVGTEAPSVEGLQERQDAALAEIAELLAIAEAADDSDVILPKSDAEIAEQVARISSKLIKRAAALQGDADGVESSELTNDVGLTLETYDDGVTTLATETNTFLTDTETKGRLRKRQVETRGRLDTRNRTSLTVDPDGETVVRSNDGTGSSYGPGIERTTTVGEHEVTASQSFNADLRRGQFDIDDRVGQAARDLARLRGDIASLEVSENSVRRRTVEENGVDVVDRQSIHE